MQDKYIGCMLGGAIGDALGMPFTGCTRAEIARSGPISEFLPAAGTAPVTLPLTALADGGYDDPLLAGQWTDDTQLSLALAEAIIGEQGQFVPDAWAHALVQWLNRAPRGPGLSSLEAAVQLRTGGAEWDEAADPDGAGCGAATRAAPIALAFPFHGAARRRWAALQAMTTHGHADAHAAAVAIAEAVALVLPLVPAQIEAWNGTAFLQAIIDAVGSASPAYAEFVRCLELARRLAEDDLDTETAVRVLGVSAWSREAVPAALYLVAREGPCFEKLLWSAVNLTGGAVESIGAMAGAIGGALHGAQGVPGRWRRGVEDAPRLIEAALGLHRLIGAGHGGVE